MKIWNSRSISGKLLRVNLLVSGTALLLAYISFLAYDLYSFRQSLIRSVGTEAQIIGANSVAALLFDDQQAETNTLSALENSPQIQAAVVIRKDGREFARYLRDRTNDTGIDVRLDPGESTRYWTIGRNILLGSRIYFQGKSVGTVYLLAETRDVIRRVEQFGLISAGILVLCFLIALLATSSIRHHVTDPLTELAETAQIVSREKDYSVRARLPRGNDELAFLVQSFNEMLEQIEESRSVLEKRVLERTSELTAANKELEAFSYSVAHDLRGPLQHIINIGFLLQSVHEPVPNSESRILTEKLLEGSKRMSSLIDDLLNLSRATSHALHRTPIDLSQMAQGIVANLKAEAEDRNVRFVLATGARVIADEGLLQVALENLLGNAWKYTSKIESAEIEFGYNDEQDGTVYFVRDNGAGFNPAYADRLFRPFQRLHAQSEFPGTGIGLATAHRIITRHGGKIWATGNLNQGATFSFTLPYSKDT